ncbi:MAG TPA: alpha/beta hydrolase [Pirellulales bacterium]|nr:alpha/beta hydrolase [Pirellulales bacterium]
MEFPEVRVAPPPAPLSRQKRLLRAAWRCVRAAAIIYLVILLVAMFFEERLIFFPSRTPREQWDLPGVERAKFAAVDGTRLHGWYFSHPKPRACVLFACGNAGNISYRAERFQRLCDVHRLALLAFDYRGYGLSEGQPNEAGILLDARAARNWLAERAGVSEGEIVLMGESLGGGVMVDLASRDGARGLILERTFTSLPDVAAYFYPLLPVRMLMRNRLDSLAKIADYRGPLVHCHGDVDEIIPFEMGRRLFAAANDPKRFVALSGVGHNDPLPDEWDAAIYEFVRSLQ